MMKLGLTLLGLAFAAFSTNTASAAPPKSLVDAGTVRVATDFSSPPWGFYDANSQPTGIDVEIAKLLASDWGLKLEFVPTTSPTRIPNVQSGKADVVISSLSETAERAEVVNFTEPYTMMKVVIGGLNTLKIADWPDLKGKTVATVRGIAADLILSRVQQQYGFQIVRYEDEATLKSAGISGQADIVVMADVELSVMNQSAGERQFKPTGISLEEFKIGMATNKSNAELRDSLNNWIAERTADGTIPGIYAKYTGGKGR